MLAEFGSSDHGTITWDAPTTAVSMVDDHKADVSGMVEEFSRLLCGLNQLHGRDRGVARRKISETRKSLGIMNTANGF